MKIPIDAKNSQQIRKNDILYLIRGIFQTPKENIFDDEILKALLGKRKGCRLSPLLFRKTGLSGLICCLWLRS